MEPAEVDLRVDLAQSEIARLELLEAAELVTGSLRAGGVPVEWSTSESTARWVHDLRQEDLTRQETLDALRETPTASP